MDAKQRGKPRAKQNDRSMKELLGYIMQARWTPISWLSILRETSISPPHTAQAYVETLEKLLLAVVLEFVLPERNVLRRKNKKIHFSDALAYHAFSLFSMTNFDEAALVEGIVASHLARNYEVYSWKNKTKADAIVIHDRSMTGIETK